MDYCLELLDFLNFKFADDSVFRKKADAAPIPYDAYMRVMNLKNDVVKRTRQLAYELLQQRYGNCDYADDKGVHVYTSKSALGTVAAKVLGDQKGVACHIVRGALWAPDWSSKAQLSGNKQCLPLEQLIASFQRWAGRRLKQEDVLKEMRHYFSSLAFNDSQPHTFFGTLSHLNRQVMVHVDIHNSKGNLGVYVDMQNR
ncbi:MAG: hypothetical protein QW165_04625 [Candidatus Woesearchaeota archaeon]